MHNVDCLPLFFDGKWFICHNYYFSVVPPPNLCSKIKLTSKIVFEFLSCMAAHKKNKKTKTL